MSLPCGTRNYTYAEDMAVLRTRTHWVLLACLIVLLLSLPAYLGRYWLGVTNLVLITLIAATGLNILVGYCGQLSIGHAGFIAVGAFTSAILTSKLGMPFLVGLVGAGAVAGVVGLVFGMPSIRVKGFYLAVTTIAAQFIIVLWVIPHWGLTGGSAGLLAPPASIFGFVFTSEMSKYYLILAITALTVLFAKNLSRTRVGRAFIAVRDNDLAAEVMGINLFYYKLLAFFIGCFLAGIAGSLFAHCYYGYLTAEYFTLTESVLYVAILIIGGLGTTVGPIFGVVFIRVLEQFLTVQVVPFLEHHITLFPAGFASGIAPMLFGLIIVLFLIVEPRGLAHRWNLFKAAYRLWPFSY